MTAFQKRLWAGLCVMAVLTPLGLILPGLSGSEDAWGEWGAERLKEMLGFVPEGLGRLSELWKAPVPDYNMGGEGASTGVQVISYIASAFIGIGIVAAIIYMLARLLKRNEK